MNFSRYTYLESFLKNIINLNKKQFKNKKEKLLQEIDFQIKNIYDKQKGGYWKVTDSDKIFIEKLRTIRDSINIKNYKDMSQKTLTELADGYEKRLKVVFFAQEVSVWPSFESIYVSMVKDERFSVELVYIPFFHPNSMSDDSEYIYYRDTLRLDIYRHDEYDLSKSSPDVAFFLKPYDLIPKQYQIKDVDKVVRRIVYIRYGFEIANWNIKYHFQTLLQHKAWRFIVYGEPILSLAKKYGYRNAENVVAWGHPRADYYNLYNKNIDIQSSLIKKINGRKVILWNTQHTVQDGVGGGTFFKWKEEIFKYFEEQNDIFLLWRPHPLMFGALINEGYISANELEIWIKNINEKDNIFIDRTLDYRNSFYLSDAIVTDGTAFLIEYLYTNKPIIYTPKGKGIYFYEELYKSLYVAEKNGELCDFIDMIRQNLDPKSNDRVLLSDYLLVKNKNGVGKSIKENVLSDLINEETVKLN